MTRRALPLRRVTGATPDKTRKGLIVSVPQRLGGLDEQRGEAGPSHPRQGAQDRHVPLLGMLPRLARLRRLKSGVYSVPFASPSTLTSLFTELAI